MKQEKVNKFAILFQRLHFGHFIIVKINVVLLGITMVSSVANLYNFTVRWWYLLIGGILSIFVLWLIGYIADITGFKNAFIKHNNEATINEIRKKDIS